jgi:hypothetical protein
MRGSGYQIRPLDRTEAEQRARWVVERRYGRDPDRLLVAAEDHDVSTGAWQVTLRDGDDEFEIAFELVEGLATLTRVRRRSI